MIDDGFSFKRMLWVGLARALGGGVAQTCVSSAQCFLIGLLSGDSIEWSYDENSEKNFDSLWKLNYVELYSSLNLKKLFSNFRLKSFNFTTMAQTLL